MRLITTLLTINLTLAFAIVNAEEWQQGALVLKSQKTLRGEIAIRYDYEVVLYRVADEVMVYPAHKIQSIYIYDEEAGNNRQFISLELSLGAATFHQFYEVVLNGDVSVLRRQRIVWYSLHLDTIDYDYYVKSKDEITSLHLFKRKVLPDLLRSSDGTLSSYIRDNRLSKHSLNDMIQIIDHFNQLQTNKDQLAKY